MVAQFFLQLIPFLFLNHFASWSGLRTCPKPDSSFRSWYKRMDVDSILCSIQALFSLWKQVKASCAPRSSFAARLSTSSVPSTKDMTILKKVVLAYTSFMNKDISRASAASQKELPVHRSKDLVDALKCLILELLATTILTSRIHQEVSLILSKNVEL
ncbi:Uncharacterized protein Adt_42359 [Abeliophyllum distichum]|uniref:Uncharacterized protein n=1 Tax=Abeliophyllum distichum TaxID=126358 RepID=A0ABD1PT32_9LAMI